MGIFSFLFFSTSPFYIRIGLGIIGVTGFYSGWHLSDSSQNRAAKAWAEAGDSDIPRHGVFGVDLYFTFYSLIPEEPLLRSDFELGT